MGKSSGEKKNKKIYVFVIIFILLVLLSFIVIGSKRSIQNVLNDNLMFGVKKMNTNQLTEFSIVNELRLNETRERQIDLENRFNELELIFTKQLSLLVKAQKNVQDVMENDEECSVIFTLSSASAGNDRLFSVISNNHHSDVDVFYESPPNMGGDTLLKVKTMGFKETYYTRKNEKIEAIKKQMSSNIWMDTSYLFLESWYDVALDYFLLEKKCQVKVIILRRYMPFVIHDLIEADFLNNEHNWYHSANSKTATLPRLPTSTERGRMLDNIIWYLLDVEESIHNIQNKYSNATFVNIYEGDLDSKEYIHYIFTMLGLNTPKEDNILIKPHQIPDISQSTTETYINTVHKIVDNYKLLNITVHFDTSILYE